MVTPQRAARDEPAATVRVNTLKIQERKRESLRILMTRVFANQA
jgi:hypothetical protein